MTELVQSSAVAERIAAVAASLAETPTEDLTSQLFAELRVTAERVVRVAAIVRVLEDRGVDLSDLKLSMLDVVRRVAHGAALPDLVERFQSRPLLLERATLAPVDQQAEIVASGTVRVASIVNGDVVSIDKSVADLTRDETHQVFSRVGVRSPSQQAAWLEKRRSPRAKSQPEGRGERPRGVTVDKSRGGIVVGGKFISKKALARYLAELS